MSHETTSKPRYKIAIVGPPGVGKTSFLFRAITGEFRSSVGVMDEWFPCQVRGVPIELKEFHAPPQNPNVDAVIIMVAVDDHASCTEVGDWITSTRVTAGKIPMVVCANKTDSLSHALSPIAISALALPESVVGVSAKTGEDFNAPLEYILGELAVESVPAVKEPASATSTAGHAADLRQKIIDLGSRIEVAKILLSQADGLAPYLDLDPCVKGIIDTHIAKAHVLLSARAD